MPTSRIRQVAAPRRWQTRLKTDFQIFATMCVDSYSFPVRPRRVTGNQTGRSVANHEGGGPRRSCTAIPFLPGQIRHTCLWHRGPGRPRFLLQ